MLLNVRNEGLCLSIPNLENCGKKKSRIPPDAAAKKSGTGVKKERSGERSAPTAFCVQNALKQ
jgi:hypothetical protein